MGELTGYIPEWVTPTRRDVVDCIWIAHACAEEAGTPNSRFAQIVAAINWATTGAPTREDAAEMMRSADGAAYDTIVWLLGHRPPPLRLPRRNPDDTLMTVDQLTAEYLTGKWNGPEERRDADTWAHREAARSRDLAALVPH